MHTGSGVVVEPVRALAGPGGGHLESRPRATGDDRRAAADGHRVAAVGSRPRDHGAAEGVVLRRADPRSPARDRPHERPDALAGVRHLGRVRGMGRREPGGRPRRGDPGRRHRPDEQRPAHGLPEHRRAGRDAGLRELGARQLRTRPGHGARDAGDGRAGGGRGADREGRARRPGRAAVRAVPGRARRRPRVSARVDGADRRPQQAQAGRDRGGLGRAADRARGARGARDPCRRAGWSATAPRPTRPTAAPAWS